MHETYLWIRKGLLGMRVIQALNLHWKQMWVVGGCTEQKCCWNNIRCAVINGPQNLQSQEFLRP